MPFPLDEKQVCILEDALGTKLPECYREFMKTKNGGSIYLDEDDWELHPIQDTTDRKRICRTASHVMVENISYSKWHNAVPDTLSIACNGCGDLLILQRVGNKYQPTVFFLDHETGQIAKAANSISDAIRC